GLLLGKLANKAKPLTSIDTLGLPVCLNCVLSVSPYPNRFTCSSFEKFSSLIPSPCHRTIPLVRWFGLPCRNTIRTPPLKQGAMVVPKWTGWGRGDLLRGENHPFFSTT